MGTAGATSACQAWVITGSGLSESWWWSSSSTKSCSPTANAQETSSRASQSLRVQEGHMEFAFLVPGWQSFVPFLWKGPPEVRGPFTRRLKPLSSIGSCRCCGL